MGLGLGVRGRPARPLAMQAQHGTARHSTAENEPAEASQPASQPGGFTPTISGCRSRGMVPSACATVAGARSCRARLAGGALKAAAGAAPPGPCCTRLRSSSRCCSCSPCGGWVGGWKVGGGEWGGSDPSRSSGRWQVQRTPAHTKHRARPLWANTGFPSPAVRTGQAPSIGMQP